MAWTRFTLLILGHVTLYALVMGTDWFESFGPKPYGYAFEYMAFTIFASWLLLGVGFRINRLPHGLDWVMGLVLAVVYLAFWWRVFTPPGVR